MSILIVSFVAVALIVLSAVYAAIYESRRFEDVCLLCGHPRIEHSDDGNCAREQCTCRAA